MEGKGRPRREGRGRQGKERRGGKSEQNELEWIRLDDRRWDEFRAG